MQEQCRLCIKPATMQALMWFKRRIESPSPRLYPVAGMFLCEDCAQDYGAPGYRYIDTSQPVIMK